MSNHMNCSLLRTVWVAHSNVYRQSFQSVDFVDCGGDGGHCGGQANLFV
jgi:hypothetical protein